MIQVNATTWLGRLDHAGRPAGSLDDVPDAELDAWADRGFELMWLMGVWARGPLGVALARDNRVAWPEYALALPDWTPADVVGSPFAVHDYVVSPRLGGRDALARFRERLARRGLGLVLDLVPNHTARDHPWIRRRPDLYVSGDPVLADRDPERYFRAETDRGPRAVAFGKDPHFPSWTDTAQLNWASPELRAEMLSLVRMLAGLCDGVRCDMAMLILPDVFRTTWPEVEPPPDRGDFWPAAVAEARSVHRTFIFIAEVYWGLEERLLEQGFDYTYDKHLYDLLRAGDTAGLRTLPGRSERYLERSAHFVENHDEDPAVTAFPPERWELATGLSALLPGLRLFHEGQFDGRRVRLPVQLGRPANATPDPDRVARLDRLLAVLGDTSMADGRFRWLETDDADCLAFAWECRHRDDVVVAANVAGCRIAARVRMRLMPLRGHRVTLHDLLGDHDASVDGDALLDDGLAVELEEWGIGAWRLERRTADPRR